MTDIIQLLPDHIANQIAAGEVIQRPASAVKEMLENSIDAGAKHIHLIIKDAGKELIQVNDDGKGMSVHDARMCFERHATSKIKSIEDLFAIRSMGFRGEALASIAAVAQVELRTKPHSEEVGTKIQIEHSQVTSQEPFPMNGGSQLLIKNLFFNIPARRNFLKSDTTETRHIMDEFIRVALAFPEVAFRFTNNTTDIFHLEEGKLKLRILGLLGQHLNNKLVPVEEEAGFIRVHGFIASPEIASKTRGNQFFFVNNRFIRSAYLNHAVSSAYKELIGKDEFPAFFIFLDVDPKRVDINVHPTKQEIKFEEEKMIYAIIHSAVKHALSKYSLAPSIDFSLDVNIEQLPAVTQPFLDRKQEETRSDYLFQSFTEKGQAHFLEKQEDIRNWKELYKVQQEYEQHKPYPVHNDPPPMVEEVFQENFIQIGHAFILATTLSGCLIMNQHLAHERVLYESYEKLNDQPKSVQRLLVPTTLDVAPADALLLESLMNELLRLGYEVEKFGQTTFIIQGVPADVKAGQEKASIERIMDDFKHFSHELKLDKREKLIRVMASQKAIPTGRKLSEYEMRDLFQQLLRCEQPMISPSGKKVFIKLSSNEIHALIQRS